MTDYWFDRERIRLLVKDIEKVSKLYHFENMRKMKTYFRRWRKVKGDRTTPLEKQNPSTLRPGSTNNNTSQPAKWVNVFEKA